jgi:hypothetical protein
MSRAGVRAAFWVAVDARSAGLAVKHALGRGELGFTHPQIEHVLDEGQNRSATTRRLPYQVVL